MSVRSAWSQSKLQCSQSYTENRAWKSKEEEEEEREEQEEEEEEEEEGETVAVVVVVPPSRFGNIICF